jgi:F-type H+-transporting ATPase subunit epsilon
MSSHEGGPKTLDVEIVTPEGSVLQEQARMIVVPGADGELGVLPRHAALVAELNAGETRVRLSSDESQFQRYATGPGYFKVQGDTAVVLVDSAVKADEIDVSAAQKNRDDAQAELEALGDDEEQQVRRRAAERALATAENQLKVAGGGGSRG